MNKRIPVYLFRDRHFSPRGDTVVSVASRDVVVAVFGSGGVMNGDGISKVFGGSCAFRNEIPALSSSAFGGSATRNGSAMRFAKLGCYWKSCMSVLRQGW